VHGQWETTILRATAATFSGEIAMTWMRAENRKETFVP
jgi:hypothetical protein